MTEDNLALEHLVDRQALVDLLRASVPLADMSLQIVATEGPVLAGTDTSGGMSSISCTCLRRHLLTGTAHLVELGLHSCCPGIEHQLFPLEHAGRRLGYLVVGPYAVGPSAGGEEAATLGPFEKGPAVMPGKAPAEHGRERATKAGSQLAFVIELLIDGGLRALIANRFHLACMEENYRTGEAKAHELRVVCEQARESDRLKGNLLAAVSHELKTPLSSIVGLSELLSDGSAGLITDEQHHVVKQIRDSGARLLALIEDLIALSELEAGRLAMVPTTVDAGKLASAVASSYRQQAAARSVTFELKLEEDLPQVWADAARLQQALLRLMDNAFKFTPDGGRITLGVRQRDVPGPDVENLRDCVLLPAEVTMIEFRVTDSGIGIPEPARTLVFAPFHQLDSGSERRHGGIGVGLSVVRHVVEAHRGTIDIESNGDMGTTFVVRLPITPGAHWLP